MRLQFLDRLRCLAVIAIVAQHYLESAFPVAAKPFLSLGPGVFGVALFFMISGYVIPLSHKTAEDWRSFVIRRIFRILPMYWVTLNLVVALGAFGLAPYAEIVGMLGPMTLISNAVLLFEYAGDPALLGVAWSLSLEFIWYGMFCVMICIWGAKRSSGLSLIYSVGLIALCAISILADTRLPFGRMLMLNAALLGFARFQLDAGELGLTQFLRINIGFIAAMGISLWTGFSYFEHPAVSISSNITAWSASYFIFTISCSSKLSLPSMPPTASIFGFLGLWSYSIYLLHEPLKNLLSIHLNGWPLIMGATLATLGTAAITYRMIETPMMRIGRRLAEMSRQKPTSRPKPSLPKTRKI